MARKKQTSPHEDIALVLEATGNMGFIRVRRAGRYFVGARGVDRRKLCELTGRYEFPAEDYDKVLASVNERGYGVEEVVDD